MMTRIAAVFLAASALSACTSLSGCGGPEAVKVAPRSSDSTAKVTRDTARQLSDLAFVGRSRWYAVPSYSDGTQIVLIGERSADAPDQRLVRLNRGGGYDVSRIRISCPRGGYVVRDTRSAKTDAAPLGPPRAGGEALPLMDELSKICARTAKLPAFDGGLSLAVGKARAMNNSFDPLQAGPPKDAQAPKIKGEGPPPTQVFDLSRRGPDGLPARIQPRPDGTIQPPKR